MRLVYLLAVLLLIPLSASARMGDSLAQTLVRYGKPVAASDPAPSLLTSTKTFGISGLTIICGYLNGRVMMETITNPSRDFVPTEVEALLRTESQHQGWNPPGPYAGTMNYTRRDGVTAKLTGNKLEILTSAWTTALAKDAATQKAAATGQTNAAPTAPIKSASTITTSSTSDDALSPPPKHAGHVTTNAAP